MHYWLDIKASKRYLSILANYHSIAVANVKQILLDLGKLLSGSEEIKCTLTFYSMGWTPQFNTICVFVN